jgi:hypothetical protein
MASVFRNSLVAGLAALTIGLGVAASTTSASAQQAWPHGGGGYHGGGGWHGGGGGWHGGGGGGGWHGGGRGWHGGGGGWGPAVGLGVLGGLAAGAIVASQSPYYAEPQYYGGDDCTQYRPIYDGYGRYLGRRLVDVCQ